MSENGEGYIFREVYNLFLTIDLINSISNDPETIETISQLAIKSLSNKFKFKTLYIYNVTEKERKTLMEKDIK